MAIFFAYSFALSLLFLVIGIIAPKIVIRWGEIKTRKKAFKVYGTICIISFVLMLTFSPPSNTTQPLVSQQENNIIKKQNNHEFDDFYQDFKKNHDMQEKVFTKLKTDIDNVSRGSLDLVDFYTNLKNFEGYFLNTWLYWDNKKVPSGLNEEQRKEIKQSIEFMAFSALYGKETVQALKESIDNPKSISAQSNFKENLEKALTTHKIAGENIEKIRNELTQDNKD